MIAWKILRARFWSMDRQLRTLPSSARAVALGLVLLLGIGGNWGYGKLVGALSTEIGAAISPTVALMILLMLLFFVLIGLSDMMYRL